MNTCPYVCNNKTIHGYCCSTACINPLYNQQSVTKWLEKADYVPVVRCKDCKHRFKDGDNVRFNVCELNHNKVQSDDWFCADGERKDDE